LNAFLRARLTVTPSRSRTFTLVASNSTGEPIRNSRTTDSPRRVVDLWLADGSTGGRSRKDRYQEIESPDSGFPDYGLFGIYPQLIRLPATDQQHAWDCQ
jgi:hypothetical protein